MSEDLSKSKLGQLLERLQEESWQLELLISGFAIFLVAGSKDAIWNLVWDIGVLTSGTEGLDYLAAFAGIVIASWLILLINLILHVLIRGLWISAIGLRYVSDDIDFEKLDFAPKFDSYLKAQIPSFDRFIERLEKLASIVFAFTFIIIFMILSLGLFVLFMMGVSRFCELTLNPFFAEQTVNTISLTLKILFCITAFIYQIDFMTLGWIKQRRSLQKFYYPIYRFYGWITLAALYRPLYYNLIDNKFGRRIGFLLVPYLMIVTVVTSMEVDSFQYFPKFDASRTFSDKHYQDRKTDNGPQRSVTIPSKYISDDFLEVFIFYYKNDDNAIESVCPDLIPDKSIGTKFSVVKFSQGAKEVSSVDSLLLCHSLINQVMIDDSIITDIDYLFYNKSEHNQKGLLATLNIGTLSKGKHIIQIDKKRKREGDLSWLEIAKFPFWKTE